MIIKIPYPPTINSYWGFNGNRRFLTAKARQFKADVAAAVLGLPHLGDARLSIQITLHASDRRVRDIDNVLKPTLDALVQAGLFEDDGQVDRLLVIRGDVEKNGCAVLDIAKISTQNADSAVTGVKGGV